MVNSFLFRQNHGLDSPALAHHAPAHAVVILTAPSLMLIEAAVATTAAAVMVPATAAPGL